MERHGFAERYQSDSYLRQLESVWFLYWTDPRHDQSCRKPPELPVVEFRSRNRYRTSQAALVVCLRIGIDPPDVFRTDPCARLECWVDHSSISPEKALDQIGKQLQRQYESLAHNSKVKYRTQLDPVVEDTKKMAISLRRQAKEERVLYHYNGHGVPKSTESGEIWVFNRQYTQYMPIPLQDLLSWLGSPTIFVWDCSNAGHIVAKIQEFAAIRDKEAAQTASSAEQQQNNRRSSAALDPSGNPLPGPPGSGAGSGPGQGGGGNTANTTTNPSSSTRSSTSSTSHTATPISSVPFSETIQLGACKANQSLPMNPELPADLFTSCLTSPIQMAVRFFLLRNPLRADLDADLAFKIPGSISERKTPFGELNWIFIAITDTIAWNTLPKELFQKLFRHDLVVAALFRGFLLAERIMRYFDCEPVSVPVLPKTHNHPIWEAWDLAVDRCVNQLPAILANKEAIERAQNQNLKPPPELTFGFSRFFYDQLTAFEIWLDQGAARCLPPPVKIVTSTGRKVYAFRHLDGTIRTHPPRPEQLPIVLQVLLSHQHRVRALILLCKFFDLGFWAVDLSLSVGIFPYVLNLLHAPGVENKPLMIYIWTRIIGVCRNCQDALFRQTVQTGRGQSADLPYQYFVRVLASPDQALPIANVSEHRAMCAFILAMFCRGFRAGQEACLNRVEVNWQGPAPQPLHTAIRPSSIRFAAATNGVPMSPNHPNITTDSYPSHLSLNVLEACLLHLSDSDPLLRQWSAFCIAQLYYDYDEAKGQAVRLRVHEKFHNLLTGRDDENEAVPEVRAAVLYALGTLVGTSGSEMLREPLYPATDDDLKGSYSETPFNSESPPTLGKHANEYYGHDSKDHKQSHSNNNHSGNGNRNSNYPRQKERANLSGASPERTGLAAHELIDIELGVAMMTLRLVTDGSPIVRRELVVLLSAIVIQHIGSVVIAAYDDYKNEQVASSDPAVSQQSGRLSPGATWALLEKEEQQRQEALLNSNGKYFDGEDDVDSDDHHHDHDVNEIYGKRNNGQQQQQPPHHHHHHDLDEHDGENGISEHNHFDMNGTDDDGSPAPASSSPAFRSMIFSCIYKSVTDLAADSYPEVSEPASQVLDAIHAKLFTSPLATARDSVLKNINPSLRAKVNDQQTVADARSILLEEDRNRIRRMRKLRSGSKRTTRESALREWHADTEDDFLPPPCRQLPLQSDFYDSCSKFFTEPQMRPVESEEPGSIHYNERLWRRDRADKIILATQPLKDAASNTRWDEPYGQFNNDAPLQKVMFHQFEPHLIGSDANGSISVYDWRTNTLLNKFRHETLEVDKNPAKYPSLSRSTKRRSSPVTALQFVNEEDVALLLTGTEDGNLRLFRNYENPKDVELVSSFRALNEMVGSTYRQSGLVVEWQQGSGNLLAGGNVKHLRVWDAPREMCIRDIPTRSNSCMTSITSDQVDGRIIVAGFGDSTVRVYDKRNNPRDAMVLCWRHYHSSWINNVHMQRGGARELISASLSGEVCVWDIRNQYPINKLYAYEPDDRHSLTSMAVHEHASVFATGSDLGSVKIWNINDSRMLSSWGNDSSKFLQRSQRAMGINSIVFHPHHMMMATAEDAHINLYKCALNNDPKTEP